MSKELIRQYYNQLHSLKRTGISNEMAIKQPFDMLLLQMAGTKHYVYATEVTIKNKIGKYIRPDGILMNELRIQKGLAESKDTDDSLDDEIHTKLHKNHYPPTNIIFQDSQTAVLIQNEVEVMRVNMHEMDELEKILLMFINYKPAYIERFEDALEKFKEDIPTIVETLRELIEEQHQTNKTFQAERDKFWEMCKQEINPEIALEDIREMIVQHILTEDLFKAVFDETDFHHENNIARELEGLVNTFMNRATRQNQLGELGHYYRTLNAHASQVADHHEKQRFLKVVYENFYKVYNPKGADRLGVVYTPNEIVDFMIRSTDYLLDKHFGRSLHHQNVHILDPATGTGTFITDIIEHIPYQYLEYKYEHEIHANEVAILPYYVANLNIEFTYKQKTGQYKEFPNICFVDTLDNTASLTWDRMKSDQAPQISMFGMSSENAERIKRQNQQRISVVIGNPPYNAKQANYNFQNSNRAYNAIDSRIKNTFIKEGTAQNQIVVYDMYTRFYRWAMDRLDQNGMITFITNRSFIDGRAFNGFRKCIERDFDYCYIIDTKSDVRANPKIAGTTHNVFGIQTGVAIMFLIRKEERAEGKCQIYYNGEIEDNWLKERKLEWLKHKNLKDISFEVINPSKNYNWINLSDNDFNDLIPLIDKEVKAGKSEESIFKMYSRGVATQRDEWVYDFNKKSLKERVNFMISIYQKTLKKPDFKDKMLIKWDRELQKYLDRKIEKNFSQESMIKGQYRPFVSKWFYFDRHFNGMTYQWFDIYNAEDRQKIISIPGLSSPKEFHALALETIIDLNALPAGCQNIPMYCYDENGNRQENVTDWGLEQFQTHYEDASISKKDIFHYTYGVLHDPAYRKKYELNLKREFPRIPFYEDFHQWKVWGEELMGLHINYEDAAPFKLALNETVISSKPKAKLKADKAAGTIQLDENTQLSGIPAIAWEYKLGNRSALEWILDQYKEKKPRDKTIREKFNTYKFADYKKEVIKLLQKVTTVSVKTMEIVREMEKVGVGDNENA
ncbi:MAG: type ISP restriction/modification enzyme [Balneolaceae bacterium]